MKLLEDEIRNQKYWDETYNKMILKQGFSKDNKELLLKIKEIYKDNIINDLFTGRYNWSVPRKVEIAKHESSKKRVVYIYSIQDRYIIGVLYRAISNYYKSHISNSCFSYKKSIGTSNAITYIKENRKNEYKYGVKVDIHAYFNSVNKRTVTDIINLLFDGGFKRSIEKLMLNDTVEWKGKLINEWKSLIPGCALGSFFANYCLKSCDEYFDNQDCIYARYSDDIVIITDSEEKLKTYIEKLIEFLKQYGLTMNPDKYTWFKPGDSIEYLGLKLDDNGNIDISDHAKQKIKKQIHRWCRKGRMEIERDYKCFDIVAKRILHQINNKNFKCFVNHEETFGWCIYAFPKITTIETLKEIDLYTKDCIRALKTGKHNKANYGAISEEEFHKLGWVSLVQLYYLFKDDYDYYCEVIELI